MLLKDDAALADLRRDMLRFARLQLRDADLAEDAVQEAMAAACAQQDRFDGRAGLRTWVFAILRNKLVDQLRRRGRSENFSTVLEPGFDDAAVDALFRANGHWRPETRPASWTDPEAAATRSAFWHIFEACLDHLPESLARVFMMREMLGLETAEICTELAISKGNCHVMLHRARLGLRACLEGNWFSPGECPTC